VTRSAVARFLSAAFLAFATLLVAYGLFGLSRSAWYVGEYFDDRLVLFDNGVYPFLWGYLFLLLGQLLRLHLRRPFMGAAAFAGLLLFLWKRVTVPAHGVGQEIFPDAELLNELIVMCVVMLGLVLADRHLQYVIDLLLARPCRALWRKLKGQE
jgi:hypothetical protein